MRFGIFVSVFALVIAASPAWAQKQRVAPPSAEAQADQALYKKALALKAAEAKAAAAAKDIPAASADVQEAWKNMSPEEKASVKSMISEQLAKLNPTDKAKLEQATLQKWQSMTPDQQQILKDAFGDLLKGDLKTK